MVKVMHVFWAWRNIIHFDLLCVYSWRWNSTQMERYHFAALQVLWELHPCNTFTCMNRTRLVMHRYGVCKVGQDRINTPHMTAYIMKSQTPLHTLFCCGSSHWGAAYYKSHDTYSLAKDLHTYTLRICIWNSAVEQLRVLSYLISAVVGSFLLDLCGIFFLLTWSLLASYLISFCFLLDLFLFLTWSLFPSYLVPFCFLLDLCGTAVGPLLLDLCSVQFAHAQWQRCTEA